MVTVAGPGRVKLQKDGETHWFEDLASLREAHPEVVDLFDGRLPAE